MTSHPRKANLKSMGETENVPNLYNRISKGTKGENTVYFWSSLWISALVWFSFHFIAVIYIPQYTPDNSIQVNSFLVYLWLCHHHHDLVSEHFLNWGSQLQWHFPTDVLLDDA